MTEPFSDQQARLDRERREPPVESPAWKHCTQLCRGTFRSPCPECVADAARAAGEGVA